MFSGQQFITNGNDAIFFSQYYIFKKMFHFVHPLFLPSFQLESLSATVQTIKLQNNLATIDSAFIFIFLQSQETYTLNLFLHKNIYLSIRLCKYFWDFWTLRKYFLKTKLVCCIWQNNSFFTCAELFLWVNRFWTFFWTINK